ncbi:MAG TPA: glycosyltransferase [Spirochaetia bacterium]|nr:glycosyltransferase family 4 protein [Spirochaetaceae bacterium]HRW23525.1 glycosyltransferase [Spirochaetia bacterium]
MYLTKTREITRVGFVSTRFQGTDGVSLETWKWNEVLTELGYETFFFSGMSDWFPERSMVVEDAFFGQPRVKELHDEIFDRSTRRRGLTAEVGEIKGRIKAKLYDFVKEFDIDVLIVENAFAIPMHIPLGIALAELVAEMEMPTIAHNHDFAWERQRFMTGCAEDYIVRAFPPRLHSVYHVVINSEARRQLAFRCGISSVMIPNVWDFDAEPTEADPYNGSLRSELGMGDEEVLFLQPTRIVARKGIESAIELVARYNDMVGPSQKGRLLISHPVLDEGNEYQHRVLDYAKYMDVELIVRPDLIDVNRGTRQDGGKVYSLWDTYVQADFVTYPSTYEGFGNAFLEAIFYRKPILVNRYAIYAQDIEPLGFRTTVMDGYVTDAVVKDVARVLSDPMEERKRVAENFAIGKRYLSYEVLRRRLPTLFMNFGAVS